MKFYGNGVVWPVGRFVDGVFETEDPKLIEHLKAAGFIHDEEPKQLKVKIEPKKGGNKK
jgi:hypothetical protein